MDQVPGLTTREIFAKNFDLNVTGPAILTDALLPLLTKSTAPRVVSVSWSYGSISMTCDKTSPWYNPSYEAKGCGCSKAAVNRLIGHYSRLLADTGGLVNSVCPSLVKTRLTGYPEGGRTPEQGAKSVVEYANEVSHDGDNATCLVVRLGGWERRSEGGLGSLGTKEMRDARRAEALDPRRGRR